MNQIKVVQHDDMRPQPNPMMDTVIGNLYILSSMLSYLVTFKVLGDGHTHRKGGDKHMHRRGENTSEREGRTHTHR